LSILTNDLNSYMSCVIPLNAITPVTERFMAQRNTVHFYSDWGGSKR